MLVGEAVCKTVLDILGGKETLVGAQ